MLNQRDEPVFQIDNTVLLKCHGEPTFAASRLSPRERRKSISARLGTLHHVLMDEMLKAYGITDDIVHKVCGVPNPVAHSDVVRMLQDGQLDVAMVTGPVPYSFAMQLPQNLSIRLPESIRGAGDQGGDGAAGYRPRADPEGLVQRAGRGHPDRGLHVGAVRLERSVGRLRLTVGGDPGEAHAGDEGHVRGCERDLTEDGTARPQDCGAPGCQALLRQKGRQVIARRTGATRPPSRLLRTR